MNEQLLTILPQELQGTVLVTGELGIGKTSFAVTAELPERTCFIDYDEKGKAIADAVGITEYLAPTTKATEPSKAFEIFEEWLEELEEGKFTTVIIDNISAFEDGIRQKIIRNAKFYADKYNLSEKNILRGSFGGANTPANKMLSEIVAKFRSKGIHLIIQIAHTGNKWVSQGIVPNKRTIKGLSRWDTLSILSLVLIPPRDNEEQTGAPAALVRKEQLASYDLMPVMTAEKAARMARGEGGHKVKRRLPRRIYPCTWENIKGYLANPTDFKNPEPHEVPLEEEIAPYEERLSKDQISFLSATLILSAEEMKREASMSPDEIIEDDMKVNQMYEALENFGGNITPIDVRDELIALGYDADIPMAAKVIRKIQENEQ